MLLPRITRESPDALNDRWRCLSNDSLVVQESPIESLFKDRYFVGGIGSGLAKRFKDPAQVECQIDVTNKHTVGHAGCGEAKSSLTTQNNYECNEKQHNRYKY